MILLLDTHALIWWLIDSPQLSSPARLAISHADNQIWVSAASAWEMTTKYRVGKLSFLEPIIHDLIAEIRQEGFHLLDITFAHACLAGNLRHDHKDPFDRMLIAQSLLENYVLVSNEALFDSFGIQRLW